MSFSLLISGYIHFQIEKQNQLFSIIPDEIVILCRQYYGDYFEYFDNETKGKYIQIISRFDKPTAILKDYNGWNCVYGSIIIDSTKQSVYEWTFRINKINKEKSIIIGIIECDDAAFGHQNQTEYISGNYYAWNITSFHKFDTICFSGDIVQMELDTFNTFKSDMFYKYNSFGKKPHLKFYKNEELLGDAYNDITVGPDFKYQLVICLGGQVQVLHWKSLKKTYVVHSQNVS